MKKILFVLSWFLIFMYGCSNAGDDLAIPDENVSAINLPKESEAYGQAVAQELRSIVFRLIMSPIPNGCGVCLQYCLVQGSWPPYSTHKCN